VLKHNVTDEKLLTFQGKQIDPRDHKVSTDEFRLNILTMQHPRNGRQVLVLN
jgi:hypothetical protein